MDYFEGGTQAPQAQVLDEVDDSEETDLKARKPATEAPNDYGVEHIAGHTKIRNKSHYLFRWYTYTEKDEYIYPTKDIPKQFIIFNGI